MDKCTAQSVRYLNVYYTSSMVRYTLYGTCDSLKTEIPIKIDVIATSKNRNVGEPP